MPPTLELARAFIPFSDMSVRADGDGHIVDAYMSVFDAPYEVRDWDGHYLEVFRRGAFKRNADHHARDGFRRLKVLFNHGKDLYGMPSDRFAMPIGNVLDYREDDKGLFTSTRYARTDLAVEALEHIREERITGYSMQFRPVRSKTTEPDRPGDLATIERLEVEVREYGPAVFPANPEAEVVGVRAIAEHLQRLTPDQVDALLTEIRTPGEPTRTDEEDGSGDPPADDHTPDERGVPVRRNQLERELELIKRRDK